MARKKKGEQNTMSDIQKANMIEFEYNGKAYCLEYTPDTIKRMEANGFKINEIGDMPATRLEQLWAGAFLAHHRKAVGDGIPEKLFKQMKRREELLKKLIATKREECRRISAIPHPVEFDLYYNL